MEQIGDTTLKVNQLAEFWRASADRLSDAEQLIFGDTPMCEALGEIEKRFQRELLKLTGSREVVPLLLLVSDGDPTDGDPEPIAARIRELGVSFVSCYLTDIDLASPRRLTASPQPNSPDGAKRLFRMASILDNSSPLTHYLIRSGWTVEQDARCFVQANHSEILREFVGLTMSPSETGGVILPKGD
jgi:hypothetical protein